MLLDKLLLLESGHRVLIFSQMIHMLDILAEYLSYRQLPFQRLYGDIKADIRKQVLENFNAEGFQNICILLSTEIGGHSINLSRVNTVFIFDSNWTPHRNFQFQAHRTGQNNRVNIYRLFAKNSVEEGLVKSVKQEIMGLNDIQKMDISGRTVLNEKSKTKSIPFDNDELAAIIKFGTDKEEGWEEPLV